MVAKGERNSRSLQGPLHTPNHGITPNDNNHPCPQESLHKPLDVLRKGGDEPVASQVSRCGAAQQSE